MTTKTLQGRIGGKACVDCAERYTAWECGDKCLRCTERWSDVETAWSEALWMDWNHDIQSGARHY